jgi:hypothetical protein
MRKGRRTKGARNRRGGKAVERRERVIGENQIKSTVFKSGQEFGARLDAGYFTGEIIRFKELLNEFRILNAILQQQNAERGRHGAFFTLPGGGALMTAQKTPSSLMALTNS